MTERYTTFGVLFIIIAMEKDEQPEPQDLEDDAGDVDIDECKDMPIDLLESSRKRFLQWNGLDD